MRLDYPDVWPALHRCIRRTLLSPDHLSHRFNGRTVRIPQPSCRLLVLSTRSLRTSISGHHRFPGRHFTRPGGTPFVSPISRSRRHGVFLAQRGLTVAPPGIRNHAPGMVQTSATNLRNRWLSLSRPGPPPRCRPDAVSRLCPEEFRSPVV